MAAFGHFSRNFLIKSLTRSEKPSKINSCCSCLRQLSYTPKQYDGNPDPAPIFIKDEVQTLLKTLTRIDIAKVYRKRKLGEKRLEQPIYKFMTSEQLEDAMKKIKEKVDDILQIPPVVSVRKHINTIFSKDPALQGFDTSTFVFTDITFGVKDSERLIVVRDLDGTLKAADWDVRDRINQTYFPVKDRNLKIPKMFEDNNLEQVLNRQDYEFILDRACLQFEPDDPMYQKTTSLTYQHLNDNNAFETLRSTRHFGSLAFFLSWHKIVDNLMLELVETGHIDEVNALVELYGQVNGVKIDSDGKTKSIEEYIKKFSSKSGALELALQAYKEAAKQKEDLERGIKRAHGLS